MTMLTTSTFWNTFLRTPNEASAKGTGTDSFVQYPSTAQSLSDVCRRCTWAGIKQSKFIVFERLQLGIFVLTCQRSAWRCAHNASSSLQPATHCQCQLYYFHFWTQFMYRTEDCELSSRPWALRSVFYYLQLKLAMNKEIKINELACYEKLCVEWKKPASVPFQMDLTVHTVCESAHP